MGCAFTTLTIVLIPVAVGINYVGKLIAAAAQASPVA